MSRNVAEITEEALKLPHLEQYKLARRLLENAESEKMPGIDQSWNEEIERRIQAIDSGVAKGRPFAEVLKEVDLRLGKS